MFRGPFKRMNILLLLTEPPINAHLIFSVGGGVEFCILADFLINGPKGPEGVGVRSSQWQLQICFSLSAILVFVSYILKLFF